MKNSEKTFGQWEPSVHSSIDQLKRITSAKKKDVTPTSIDKENMIGIFPGSGKSPYTTTLDNCNCGDFFRRKLPCKHIYRLAMECEVYAGIFTAGVNKNLQLTIQEVVAELENYSDESQRFVLDVLSCITKPGCERIERYITDDMQDIFSSHLFVLQPIGAENILHDLRKMDIEALLEELDVSPARKMTKNDLIPWCVENIPNIASFLPKKFIIESAENFKKATKKAYTYLSRKYCTCTTTELCQDGQFRHFTYPAGAKRADEVLSDYRHDPSAPMIYYFPKDEITALLTLYNHNHCLNGFIPEVTDI